MEKTTGEADIQENKLKELSPDLLNTLLKDHTTSKEGKQCNIFWATSDYEPLGRGYEYGSQILPGADNRRERSCGHAPCFETQGYPKHTFPGNGGGIYSVLDM